MFVLRCRWFLKPVSTRFSPVVYSAQYTKILQKKPKSSAVQPETCSPPSAPLSPEQLDRMARNKRAALEKLASAQTPPGFGESWREGLSAEFGKPYFKQVRGRVVNTLQCVTLVCFELINELPSFPQLMKFVSEERKRHTVYPPADHVFTWTQTCDVKDVSCKGNQKKKRKTRFNKNNNPENELEKYQLQSF